MSKVYFWEITTLTACVYFHVQFVDICFLVCALTKDCEHDWNGRLHSELLG